MFPLFYVLHTVCCLLAVCYFATKQRNIKDGGGTSIFAVRSKFRHARVNKLPPPLVIT